VLLFPGEELELGRSLEMNDHRVTIVGISDASAPFVSLPVMHTRYSQAVNFLGRERSELSFIIARPDASLTPEELRSRIEEATGLRARTTDEFLWDCIRYYLRNTGIPVNFGITIAVALVVGSVVAGQTFYLFTVENLKQFGALKAIGVENSRLVGMILLPGGQRGRWALPLAPAWRRFFQLPSDLDPIVSVAIGGMTRSRSSSW
jgi:putative ABC transport system permease protein